MFREKAQNTRKSLMNRPFSPVKCKCDVADFCYSVLMMWKSKNLFLNNELLSLLKCRKNEIENFITVRPPCYCVPFNWCGASRFYCDLIIRQIVVVSSSNGKKLKTESGDCKCAVEEMPTRKFSFEMKRSNNHRTAPLSI